MSLLLSLIDIFALNYLLLRFNLSTVGIPLNFVPCEQYKTELPLEGYDIDYIRKALS
jgi:hypothetical protein